MHALTQYIGKPWQAGARGPDAFDCWGFVWYVYKHHLGIDLPTFEDLNSRSHALLAARTINAGVHDSNWMRLIKPIDYCAVAMGAHSFVTHVGIYIETDGGLVVHCVDKQNVVADSPGFLKTGLRFGRIEYYRYGTFGLHS